AGKAGLEPGDVVIAADGKPVNNETDLRDLIANKGPNNKLSLKVLRDGKTLALEATLGIHPEDAPTAPRQQTANQEQTRPLERLGITLGEIPANLREQFGNQRGVYITRVAPDSPVSDQLNPGDLIVRANGNAISSADELERVLSRVRSGEMVRLVVVRRSGGEVTRELVMFRMP
ncbi:MAG: PDZ domain-containing protein, partial [Fimbriimonadales bacterium]